MLPADSRLLAYGAAPWDSGIGPASDSLPTLHDLYTTSNAVGFWGIYLLINRPTEWVIRYLRALKSHSNQRRTSDSPAFAPQVLRLQRFAATPSSRWFWGQKGWGGSQASRVLGWHWVLTSPRILLSVGHNSFPFFFKVFSWSFLFQMK